MTTAEAQTFEEDDYDLQPPPDVVSFNELRSCADLFRLYSEGSLDIQPFFQREVVWRKPDQTRFIDSMIKQLPIPSMCFSLDFKTQRWQVVDGLQRMTALVSFLGKDDWRLSQLEDIDPRISGKTSADLRLGSDELNILHRRVQNLSLPITVIRCDYEKPAHVQYLFTIFHRLNAGGVRLNNQEIRNCIFSGPFNNLLRELDENQAWALIKHRLPSQGKRFRSVELILRFFSLTKESNEYAGNLSKFLNGFMHSRRKLDGQSLEEYRELFLRTVQVLVRMLTSTPMAKPSYTLVETLMVGIAQNVDSLEAASTAEIGARVESLVADNSFSKESLKYDISRREKVQQRLAAARQLLA